METNKQPVDERGYFRILDYIGFDCTVLSNADYDRLRLGSQYAEVPVLDELSEIDQQVQLLIDRVKVKSPEFAQLGTLLNKKLDLILKSSNIAENLEAMEEFSSRQVDISATGMAFPHNEKLEVGQKLQLELVLQAGRQHLKLLAKVVGADQDTDTLSDGDPQFTQVVRVRFVDMSENISEFLIQYLVKRQGALLKSERQSK